jgi:flagellar basal body-associated protein FliL
MSTIRNAASIGAIVLGVLLVLGGGATWIMVSSTLAEQRIETPEDACLPEREVTGPFTAYCQAKIIDQHALESTDGQTYAELDREDPRRETAMNASFLQASLFTSILAFGVAAMAAGMGVIFVLIGLGMRDVAQRVEPGVAASSGTR